LEAPVIHGSRDANKISRRLEKTYIKPENATSKTVEN
jgi:hypothetical protein